MIKYDLLSIFRKTLTGEYFTFNWVAAATVAASYIQNRSARRAADEQAAAAERARGDAQFNPYDVGGIFGQSTFDRDTGTAQFDPNEFTQGVVGQLQQPIEGQLAQQQTLGGALGQIGGANFLAQGLTTDPFDVAQSRFGQLEQILNPGRQRTRENLESRLLRQGRLGSTGGSLQQEGFESGIERERQRGLFDIYNQAQAQQQAQIGLGQNLTLFGQQQQEVGLGQALNRLNALSGIETQGRGLIDLGGVLGGRQSSAGAQAGAFGLQGQAASTAAQLGAAQGLSGALTSLGTAADNRQASQPSNFSGEQGVTQGSQQDQQLADQNRGFL